MKLICLSAKPHPARDDVLLAKTKTVSVSETKTSLHQQKRSIAQLHDKVWLSVAKEWILNRAELW